MKTEQTKAQFIGGKIREARNDMGYSQLKLAEEVGFESAVAISLIESGERKINVEMLQKISVVLKRDIKFFLGEDEKIPDLEYVLRASSDLTADEKESILKYVQFTRQSRRNGI
jgi:transcriptional regulator with XRE-family HTH domain